MAPLPRKHSDPGRFLEFIPGHAPALHLLHLPGRLWPCHLLSRFLASNNRLEGPIPASLGSCLHLTQIDLSNNVPGFQGNIPPSGCPSISSLNLANNRVSGLLPRLDAWPYLTYFNIHGNQASGNFLVPPTAGLHLETLDLGSNQLTGLLPDTLDSSRNLTYLDLSSNNFSSHIPNTFPLLSSLTYLDISHNPFMSGQIPPPLSQLPHLQTLNLTSCSLSGTIPPLWTHLSPTDFAGNTGLCGPPLSNPCPNPPPPPPTPPPPSFSPPSLTPPPAPAPYPPVAMQFPPSPPLNIIPQGGAARGGQPPSAPSAGGGEGGGLSEQSVIGLSIGLAAVAAIAIFLVCRCLTGQGRGGFRATPGGRGEERIDLLETRGSGRSMSWGTSNRGSLGTNPGEVVVFASLECDITLEDILRGTRCFAASSRVLSQSGASLGVTYRCDLRDGTEVVVKRLPQGCLIGERDLRADLLTLGGIRHRHLLPLLAAYVEPKSDELLLVYRWCTRGSLDALLARGLTWQWPARQKLGLGAAMALNYIHKECVPRLIHRDFKAGNLLVGKDQEAVVGDFGLNRLVDVANCGVATWRHGTPGYAAPELVQEGRVSTKSDVYSFGVVLLQLVSGKPALDILFLERGLHKWAKTSSLEEVIDERMKWRGTHLSTIIAAWQLGIMCTAPKPSDRPSMLRVVQVLGDLNGFGNSRA